MWQRYRALGADPPGTDLRRAHPVAMEGYFWRLSDPAGGRVLVALCGVCRDRHGAPWATVALAAHPGGHLAGADLSWAEAAVDRFAVRARSAEHRFTADAQGVSVDLGSGTRLGIRVEDRREWSAPWLGGLGAAQLLPGLGQYWHPWLLGGRVRGEAEIAGERIALDGWSAYAERNWGGGGFPPRWWWGQAQGFADAPGLCVAFAGGDLALGPTTVQATSIVIAGEDLPRPIRLGNPLLAPVRAEVDGDRWRLSARGPVWAVELEGRPGSAPPHHLPVPLPAERRSLPLAHEHLAGSLSLRLRRRGRVVYAGTSWLAGLERGDLRDPGSGDLRDPANRQ